MKHLILKSAAGLLAMTAASGAAQAAAIQNGSFEAPVTSGYVYNPTVAGVTFNAGSGVQRNGSAWGFADAPDGVQTAFIQSTANYTGQIAFALTDLIVGQTYNVAFSAAARPGYAVNTFGVLVDRNVLNLYTVTNPAWTGFNTSFVATATTASLRFLATPTTTGDNDVGLDRVNVAAVPEPASWALMIAGFGAVGFAMRRRRTVSTAVTLA